MAKIKLEKSPAKSDGLIWLVSDRSGDVIQAWDCSEKIVSNHCLKHGWTYTGVCAFRGQPNTRDHYLKTKLDHFKPIQNQ